MKMGKKKFSIKGLATYMTARPDKQRKIIRDYKYPADDESRAKILYYREARDAIAVYHASGADSRWLESKALQFEADAALSPARRQARLRHNARALRAYAKHFSSRAFQVQDDLDLALTWHGVTVTVRPDLHVQERGKQKLIKLEFSKDEPDSETLKIIAQGMLEAAIVDGMKLTGTQVLVFDVPRGNVHKGARLNATRRKDIDAACQAISALWANI